MRELDSSGLDTSAAFLAGDRLALLRVEREIVDHGIDPEAELRKHLEAERE